MFKICRDTDGGQRIINYLKNKRSNGVEDPFEECGGFILSTKLMTAFRELGPKLFKSGGLLKRGVREKGGGLMFAPEILDLLIKKESFHTLHVSDQLEQEVQCFWTFEKFLLYV